jgi:uncharacterized phiE125 gp8 family phage protein
MAYKITTPAATEPVTLDEAKLHLRVDHAEEDSLIALYIQSARQYVEKVTNRILMTSTVQEFYNDYIPCSLELRFSPVQSLTFLKYMDEDEVLQTIDAADYDKDLNSEPSVITPKLSWPAVAAVKQVAEVEYVAGYESAAAVPANIKSAILLLVGEMYETRENSVKRLPTAVDHLLLTEKVYL